MRRNQAAILEASDRVHEAGSADCTGLHQHLATLPRYSFPFDFTEIPKNGIYILFESDPWSPIKQELSAFR